MTLVLDPLAAMSALNSSVTIIVIRALVVISTLVIFPELVVRAIFPIMLSIVDSAWIAFIDFIFVILTRIAWIVLIMVIAIAVVSIVVCCSFSLPILLVDIVLDIEVVQDVLDVLAELDDVIFVSQLFPTSVDVFEFG